MLKIVFDMDGVIFDTETMCMRGWKQFEKKFCVKDPEGAFIRCIGANHEWTRNVLKETQGEEFPAETFLEETGEWMRQTILKEGIPLKKGAKELLIWLKEQGAMVALASSTRIDTVKRELDMAGLLPYFQVIVGGDMVKKSKPYPDIYLCACEKLGAAPSECFAVEDSYNGVRSAGRAGMRVIMVPDRLAPTEEMQKISWKILPDLLETKKVLEASVYK